MIPGWGTKRKAFKDSEEEERIKLAMKFNKKFHCDVYDGLYYLSEPVLYKNHSKEIDCGYIQRGQECKCIDYESSVKIHCLMLDFDSLRDDLDERKAFKNLKKALGFFVPKNLECWCNNTVGGYHFFFAVQGLEHAWLEHRISINDKIQAILSYIIDKLKLDSVDPQPGGASAAPRMEFTINWKYKNPIRHCIPLTKKLLLGGEEAILEASINPNGHWSGEHFGNKKMDLTTIPFTIWEKYGNYTSIKLQWSDLEDMDEFAIGNYKRILELYDIDVAITRDLWSQRTDYDNGFRMVSYLEQQGIVRKDIEIVIKKILNAKDFKKIKRGRFIERSLSRIRKRYE